VRSGEAGTRPARGPRSNSSGLLEVDVEDQGLVGPDLRRLPLGAVGEVGRDDELAPAAGLHAEHALAPAVDHALADREREGLLAPRAVELLAVLVQHADVLDRELVAGLDRRA
jgi:hypothetical protein